MNSQELWIDRFKGFSKELQKYLRYIFNGHLLFVLVFAVGGLSFYYSEWVKTVDGDFPAEMIMAVVIGFLVAKSPINTFLKEADIVFLLPLETKLKDYFSRSIVLSFVIQGYLLLMVFAASMPMFSKVTGAGLGEFIWMFVVILLTKYINLQIRWNVLKFQEKSALWMDGLLRLIIDILLLYFVFIYSAAVFPIVMGILLVLLWLYYRNATQKKGLKWERLVELEEKRLMSFYRLANLFTDVPRLRDKVSRRKWLDPLLRFIPYHQQATYQFLYARTMLRANDYIGLLIRLTVIGSFVLAALPGLWVKLLVTLLFLYITGLQLLPVWRQHEMKIWVSLYPLPLDLRRKAVIQLISVFLLIENIVFFVVALFWGGLLTGVASLAVGIVFIILFQIYAKNRMEKF
ncbi:ABC transporter permease [Peribacillus cavernae]|uniref:ABC transporter permease n=1 Tax=Peribacillus cavernae TaxID=1674310 RepID=A0A3S0VDU1_9BACI|nr:ABC transporter permease [Peribacillus cavernae]MDQ0217602.1 ABC-2 type transport system permease protein [Peribacillus cavernae]RUQ29968.1 ABC transporter permease [Peribacillus cavernae]